MGSAFGKRERFGMFQRQGRYPDNHAIHGGPADAQLPCNLFNVRDGETLVAVTLLQKAANRLLTPAALQPGEVLLLIIVDAILVAHPTRQTALTLGARILAGPLMSWQ